MIEETKDKDYHGECKIKCIWIAGGGDREQQVLVYITS